MKEIGNYVGVKDLSVLDGNLSNRKRYALLSNESCGTNFTKAIRVRSGAQQVDYIGYQHQAQNQQRET